MDRDSTPPADSVAQPIDFAAQVARLAAAARATARAEDDPAAAARAARLEELRRAIADGSYELDPEAIARAILERGDLP